MDPGVELNCQGWVNLLIHVFMLWAGNISVGLIKTFYREESA